MRKQEDHPPEEPVSKTQRKREMTALQDLGRELTRMTDRQLEELPLPDELRAAIAEYKRLPNKHGARRRQMQYIGRVMRDVDSEPIQEALSARQQNVELEKRKLHRLEDVRQQLIDGDEATLNWLIENHPDVDIQHVRQLIRQSRKEQQEDKPPAASRKLFRYLRDTVNDQ